MKIQFCLPKFLIFLLVISLNLIACSGGGGSNETSSVNLFELIDPTPGANNSFGEEVVILGNGNIVIAEPRDDFNGTDSGAVHLYNPYTQTRLASFYGDSAGDQLGSSGITALANNNFVIVSESDDVDGIDQAGSVMLIDGNTGAQIGSTLAGDNLYDYLGYSRNTEGVTALPNGNFVIASRYDDVDGIIDAGSVMLVNGNTGEQIGNTLAGDVDGDQLGFNTNIAPSRDFNDSTTGITALANSNFVIASHHDDERGIVDAGSVRLVNGSTGEQIGNTMSGDVMNDNLGAGAITALANNNFVISTPYDNEMGIDFAGSIILMDGTTGEQIGSTLAGDVPGDLLGSSPITVLPNNNFVVASPYDNVNGIMNAGSIILIDGSTGAQIGNALVGDNTSDELGAVTALRNNNFVVVSQGDDVDGIENAGSVRLIDGNTGLQIGSSLVGNISHDLPIQHYITVLPNNNFVIAKPGDHVDGIVAVGSVMLVNGNTGAQIGNTLVGDVENDRLSSQGITALNNNNFVIASARDDEGGIVDAGSVRLVDGATGVQISTLSGDVTNDELGYEGVIALPNNNFVIASPFDDENNLFDAGSVRLMDGSTGLQIGDTLAGDDMNDWLGFGSVTALANSNFVIVSRREESRGIVDAGSVRLVDGGTGLQISSIMGNSTNDFDDARIIEAVSGDFFIVAIPNFDNNATADSGLVEIIVH